MGSTSIRDLALIGNRRSAAAVSRDGSVCWYCPGRFDQATLFASLLDAGMGAWSLRIDDLLKTKRRYLGESAALETQLHTVAGIWTVTDWMPVDDGGERLCRRFDAAPTDAQVDLIPQPDYGQTPSRFSLQMSDGQGSVVRINDNHCVHASVPAQVDKHGLHYHIPAGTAAWFVLAEVRLGRPSSAALDRWFQDTIDYWERLHNSTCYQGPYERQVKDSLRVLRLLTDHDSGGIVAAATFGLPEIIGGERNYDYRYVWLRDAGMIVSALTRAGSDGKEERRFLEFLCSARQQHNSQAPLPPFLTLDGGVPPRPRPLDWKGYAESRPVIIGNGAGRQLQLDGLANVLLAAKLIYNAHGVREHWDVVAEIADYLADHWHEPDHGIWEEQGKRQYTTGKVATAIALHFIADHAKDEPERAARWRAAEADIRKYISRHCLTNDGAYAVAARSDAVDVSAALYPVWDFCAPDSPEMLATISRLERDSSEDGLLYHRHLECDDAGRKVPFSPAACG